MEKDIRYVRSAIEDLAFTSCSSRVTIWGYPHIVGDVVLSTTLPKEQGCEQAREQRLEWKRLGVNRRSSEPPRRALQTCLMDMEHTENYAHTKWKRTVLFYFFFTFLDELDREIERDEEDREGADRETCVREVLLMIYR
jgi:hypothetical protein